MLLVWIECSLFTEVLRSGKVKFNANYHVIFVATGEEIPLNREKEGQKKLFEEMMSKMMTKQTARVSTNFIMAEPVYGSLREDNSVVYATLYDDGTIKEEVFDLEVN